MPDNTQQGSGLDLITSDVITLRNGVVDSEGAKAQVIKTGYGPDGELWDVTPNNGLPVDSAESLLLTLPITSASATAAIDTTGYSWLSLQVGNGYVGQTGLTLQASNDQVTWFTVALSPSSATSSGLTGSMGITTNLFHGPIPARFIRFLPAGAYTSGTQTLVLYMQALPGMMNAAGVNASATIAGWGTSVAPGISNGVNSLGVATGNLFQARASSSADQVATAIVAAVATQIIYVTDIYWSIWGAAAATNTPRLFQLLASANATPAGFQHNILAHPSAGGALAANNGISGERHFRNPWKVASAVNAALNLAVTSIPTPVVGNWEVIVEGYYQSS